MTMPHIREVNRNGVEAWSKHYDPDALAKRNAALNGEGRVILGGVMAIASIAARAHWLQINGQWVRK